MASATAGSSAAGSACAMLPPTVPLLRIGAVRDVAERLGQQRGARARTSGARSAVGLPDHRADRPGRRRRVGSRVSSSTRRRSTRYPGWASRKFISGTRLCPPASTRGSSSACSTQQRDGIGDGGRRRRSGTGAVSRGLLDGGFPERAAIVAGRRGAVTMCCAPTSGPHRDGRTGPGCGLDAACYPATSSTVRASCSLQPRVRPPQAAADELLHARQPVGDRVRVDDQHRGGRRRWSSPPPARREESASGHHRVGRRARRRARAAARRTGGAPPACRSPAGGRPVPVRGRRGIRPGGQRRAAGPPRARSGRPPRARRARPTGPATIVTTPRSPTARRTCSNDPAQHRSPGPARPAPEECVLRRTGRRAPRRPEPRRAPVPARARRRAPVRRSGRRSTCGRPRSCPSAAARSRTSRSSGPSGRSRSPIRSPDNRASASARCLRFSSSMPTTRANRSMTRRSTGAGVARGSITQRRTGQRPAEHDRRHPGPRLDREWMPHGRRPRAARSAGRNPDHLVAAGLCSEHAPHRCAPSRRTARGRPVVPLGRARQRGAVGVLDRHRGAQGVGERRDEAGQADVGERELHERPVLLLRPFQHRPAPTELLVRPRELADHRLLGAPEPRVLQSERALVGQQFHQFLFRPAEFPRGHRIADETPDCPAAVRSGAANRARYPCRSARPRSRP